MFGDTVLPGKKVFYLSHAYCKCINSDKGGTGESPMISVHQMGEVLGKVSGCSCTQLAEFYSTEAGVSFRRCCFRLSSKTGSQ